MSLVPHPIHSAMTDAVANAVFPGGVLLVDVAGEIVFFEAFGSATSVPRVESMSTDTVFDLASLTKPLVTAALTLSLVAERRCSLDDPVGTYLPPWREGPKARATLRHLLRQPGAESRYSDLGFILLGAVLERIGARPLDQAARERLFTPLGLSSVGYLPIANADGRAWVAGLRVAATERCPWRGRVLRGDVHDENAYAMGGVSGHAGLFGDALAVRALVRAWHDAALGRSASWPADLTTRFVTRQCDLGRGTWALGWTVPTPPSTSGRFFSPRAYGHLGFTGTSVWVDPDRDLTVVLLTNRVHPTRENHGIASFRPSIHDAIYQWLFDGSARYSSASRT